jgi:uncharacterized protein YhjY with autotransporter beta-barrel domain
VFTWPTPALRGRGGVRSAGGTRVLLRWWVGGAQLLACAGVLAQTAPGGVQGPLVQLVTTAPAGTFNELEKLSAAANQASYNLLTANPNGAVYCNPGQRAASATCPQGTFLVFSNLRELVQTANELLNNGGPTFYSLHTDDRGLGFALRWTAGENLASPGAAATQFANGQLSSIAGRLAALRQGVTGFTFTGQNLTNGQQPSFAINGQSALGGGASADSDIGIASRWGGFVNDAYGWGYRQPSVLEDAFAFDSKDATVGVDYRVNRRLVLGISGSYTNQRAQFDPARSVAGGGFDTNGFGGLLYGLYEWEGPYISFSVGYQRSNLDENRLITYPSFNIAVPSTNVTAYGSTHTNSLLANFSAGWSFPYRAFTAEPYISADYRHVDLEGFRESSSYNSGPEEGQPAGFNFDYAGQQYRVLDTSVGLRLQYAFRLPIGVIVPFVRAEYHHNFAANAYTVAAAYNAIASYGYQFNLPTDPTDTHFEELAGGFSVVLTHGIQGFVQFQTTTDLEYVTSRMVSGGIRAEF